jgi:hypothetical protein
VLALDRSTTVTGYICKVWGSYGANYED